MSVRIRITHIERVGSQSTEYRADIIDNEYSGAVQEKIARDQFFDWSYDQVDEREPMRNPVQKSSFTVDLMLDSDDTGEDEIEILKDIFDSDEKRFQIRFYINSDLMWCGNVLTDLLDYPEGDYRGTGQIKAKDLTSIEAVDYEFVSVATRARLSVIISECLKETGFNLPIRSFTNITHANANVDQDQDFLYQIHHQKLAFQHEEEPMKCMEVLEHICRAYNLIIRQANGRWIIEQLPAVAQGNDTQYDYDANGLNPVSSSPARGIQIDGEDSFVVPGTRNTGIGALKEIESTYNHRTAEDEFELPETVERTSEFENPPEFEEGFTLNTSDPVSLSVSAVVTVENPQSFMSGNALIRVIAVRSGETDLYMTNAGNFQAQPAYVQVPVSGSVVLSGSLNLTATLPTLMAVRPTAIRVIFGWAEVSQISPSEEKQVTGITYSNITLSAGSTERDFRASSRNKYTRQGNYSVTEEIPATVIGDGPTMRSIGIPAWSNTVASDLAPGGWRIRGVSENVNLQKLTLRERMRMRRKPLRLMRAELWMRFSPANLLLYDNKTWFFTGGHWKANGSRWSGTIIAFDYLAAEGDEFREFEPDGGRGRTGRPGITDRHILNLYRIHAIGQITETYNNEEITELGVNIDVPMRKGVEYWVVNESELNSNDRYSGVYSTIPVTTDSEGNPVLPTDENYDAETNIREYGPGDVIVPIQEMLMNAPEGSYIFKGAGQEEIEDYFPNFDFIDDTLEVAERTLRSTMDLIAQGVNFAKVNAENVNLVSGNILLEGVEGDLDDIANGTDFARVSAVQLSASGLVFLEIAIGDLDDIDDGTSFARVRMTSVSAGEILLAEAIGDLDDLSDGSNFQRVASTQLTAGGIVLLSVASGDLDDIGDGTNFGKVNIINIDATTGRITLVEAIGDMDDISDGSTYSRVRATNVSAGNIKIIGPDGQTVIDQGQLFTDAIFASEATISEKLTMASGSMIANSAESWYISPSGYYSRAVATPTPPAGFMMVNDANTLVGILYASKDSDKVLLSPQNLFDLEMGSTSSDTLIVGEEIQLKVASDPTMKIERILPDTPSPTTNAGTIRVVVDGKTRHIRLFSI